MPSENKKTVTDSTNDTARDRLQGFSNSFDNAIDAFVAHMERQIELAEAAERAQIAAFDEANKMLSNTP